MFKGQRKAREAVGTVSQGKKKGNHPTEPSPTRGRFSVKKAKPGDLCFPGPPDTADGVTAQDFQLVLALFHAIYPELRLEFPQTSFIPPPHYIQNIISVQV